MIYIFDGDDLNESYKNAVKLAENLSKESGKEIDIVNIDAIEDINYFIQVLEGSDLFSEGKIIIAKRLLYNKKFIDYLDNNFTNINNDLIIWNDKKSDGKLSLVKKIKKKGALYTFSELQEKDIRNWIKSESKSMSINLSTDQIDFISLSLPLNRGVIVSELTKISLYLSTKKQTEISDKNLEMLLGFDITGNIWKFLDAFGSRNKRKMFNEFIKLTYNEDNVQFIISMITRELELLSAVLSNENLDTLNIHPYVLKKTIQKSRNFNMDKIVYLTEKLFDLDLAIKSGKIEEKLGMELFLTTV